MNITAQHTQHHEMLGVPRLDERCFYWSRYGVLIAGIFLGRFRFYDDRLVLGKSAVITYEDVESVSSSSGFFGSLVIIKTADKRTLYVMSKSGRQISEIIGSAPAVEE